MHTGIKIVPQLIHVSGEAERHLFKELKKPKPLLMQCFWKTKKKKKLTDLKNLGAGKWRSIIGKFFSCRTSNKAPIKTVEWVQNHFSQASWENSL